MNPYYLIEMPKGYENGPDLTVLIDGARLRFNLHQTDPEADDYPRHAVRLDAARAEQLTGYGLAVSEIDETEAVLHMSLSDLRATAHGLGVLAPGMSADELADAIQDKLPKKTAAKKAAGGKS